MGPPPEDAIRTLMVSIKGSATAKHICIEYGTHTGEVIWRSISVRLSQGLGFERSAVVRALQASGNNMDAAANRLLTGG